MNTAGFLTARFNNFKKNLFIIDKKNKINNLKTDVIINNITKVRKDDNPNFLNNKSNFRRENKREERLYNKKNNNKNKKIRVIKSNKYHKKKEI